MINQIKLAAKFAHKDKNNAASNIYVNDGLMQSHDLVCGITLQVDSDFNFCCNAAKLNQVVSKCDPDKLKLTLKNGKLEVKSGRIRSKIDTMPLDSYPYFEQMEAYSEYEANILEDLKDLSKFTDPDDVRLFMQGVLIHDNAIVATNGHVAVKKTIELPVMDASNIPTKSIIKLSSAKLECSKLSVAENSVEFIFNGGRMFTKKISSPYPDVDRIISDIENPTVIESFIDDLKTINSMCSDDKTVVIGDNLETRDGSTKIEGVNLPECCFNSDYLINIASVAHSIDLSTFPAPCPFEGDNIKGAIVGIRI